MRVRDMCVCGVTWTDNENFAKVDDPSRQQARCREWSGNVGADMMTMLQKEISESGGDILHSNRSSEQWNMGHSLME